MKITIKTEVFQNNETERAVEPISDSPSSSSVVLESNISFTDDLKGKRLDQERGLVAQDQLSRIFRNLSQYSKGVTSRW
jgi:hypothetical protein